MSTQPKPKKPPIILVKGSGGCLLPIVVIVLLLLLLAGVSQADKAAECRVHREDWNQEVERTGCCFTADPKTGKIDSECLVQSHYIDTCKMRCDTVWWAEGPFDYRAWYIKPPYMIDSISVHCYPDTVEGDSGLITWFGVAPLPPPDSYLPRSYPAPLDSTELADLRAMPKRIKALERRLKQIQMDIAYRTCLDTLNIERRYYWKRLNDTTLTSDTLPHITVRDSCRCLYGGGK